MNKFSKLALALGGSLLCLSAAYAGIPNTSHPTTFLGPTLKARFTDTVTDTTAFSILGEAGLKNFRIGGTLGWKLDVNQYLKVSADYLVQDITYAFFSGTTDQWVSQGSISAAYRYDFAGYEYDPWFDVNAYLSHAPSKTLGSVQGTFITGGVVQSFKDNRRIAGSNAGGISPGVSIQPWQGSRAGLALNYDSVRYDKNYSPNENANGLGGTFTFSQAITEDVTFDLAAAVRKPFNNYEADVIWSNIPYYGKWALGLDADYTAGKTTLPNTYNVGVIVEYFMDQRCLPRRVSLKGDLKGEVLAPPVPNNDLEAWTATPAVYLPQVLAITDEGVQIPDPACTPVPTVIGSIAGLNNFGGTTTFNASTLFSPSSGLTYTINVTPPPTGGNSVTINPATGVITIVGVTAQNMTATVTATNVCGQAATSGPIRIFVTRIG